MDATISPYDRESCDQKYKFFGEVIKSHGVCFLHQAIVCLRTGQSMGVQSAFIVGEEGVILGTLKDKRVPHDVALEFWELFKEMLHDRTGAAHLTAEMPKILAAHYVRNYDGLEWSNKLPELGVDGLAVLEYTMEDKYMATKTKYGVGIVLGFYAAALISVGIFGADATTVTAAVFWPAAFVVGSHMLAREISSGIAKIKGLEKAK